MTISPKIRGLAAGSAAAAILLTFAPIADAQDRMPVDDLISALQGGGHVIYLRHASTETDYADQVDATMGDCSTQRTLSEAGWHEAVSIGSAIVDHGIPVGEVISSQYCRAWQTAYLAFGTYAQNVDLNFEPAEEYSDAQFATMRDNVVPLLSATPAEGTNTVLVGHDDPFDAATGIYPEPMGVVFVVQPKDDGQFEVLGSIAPDAWPN